MAARPRSKPVARPVVPPFSEDLAGLEHKLGYNFSDVSLLSTALTHQSALEGQDQSGQSYQRLEFLGDRVLGLVVSDNSCVSVRKF